MLVLLLVLSGFFFLPVAKADEAGSSFKNTAAVTKVDSMQADQASAILDNRFGSFVLSDDWKKFFQENVSFSGFVENATGLAVSSGSPHFDTSNPLVMQRFTLQPELNVKFRDDLKLFVSWKLAVEPRYPTIWCMRASSLSAGSAGPRQRRSSAGTIKACAGNRPCYAQSLCRIRSESNRS